MRTLFPPLSMLIISFVGISLVSGCSHPRVFVATGTLVGIEATPGDPQEGQVPGVTFGYRRGEVAIVPVEKDKDKVGKTTADAASTLTTFNLAYNWFGPGRIEQYLATGHASRTLLKKGSQFAIALLGYEKGGDPLADRFANELAKHDKDQATDNDKACWEAVTKWMDHAFPSLPTSDILTKGFVNQRQLASTETTIKTKCAIR